MKMGQGQVVEVPIRLHRLARSGHRAWHWRPAERPDRRDLRAGILGQDDAGAAHGGRSAEAGGICAFIDAEHALDPIYARKLGVDIDDLLISQPDAGEQALEIADTLVRSGAIDVLVIDSVAALTPKAELEGEMGDSLPGLQARLMSQALRKLTASISKSKCMVIFINQIRMKIGVMFGSPGNHHRRQRAEVLRLRPPRHPPHRRDQGPRRGVGNQTRVKVVKNKLAPPFRQVEFDIIYGEGVSKMGELIDLGVKGGMSRSPAPGSPTTASGSARAVRTPSSSCAKTRRSPMRSNWRSARTPG
jgi:recombination protein RecA